MLKIHKLRVNSLRICELSCNFVVLSCTSQPLLKHPLILLNTLFVDVLELCLKELDKLAQND